MHFAQDGKRTHQGISLSLSKKCTYQLISELYDAEFTLTHSFAFQIRDRADVSQNKLIQRRYLNLAV